jgi:hypothetical protein
MPRFVGAFFGVRGKSPEYPNESGHGGPEGPSHGWLRLAQHVVGLICKV